MERGSDRRGDRSGSSRRKKEGTMSMRKDEFFGVVTTAAAAFVAHYFRGNTLSPCSSYNGFRSLWPEICFVIQP